MENFKRKVILYGLKIILKRIEGFIKVSKEKRMTKQHFTSIIYAKMFRPKIF
jgi:hypothetical protein